MLRVIYNVLKKYVNERVAVNYVGRDDVMT